MATIAIGDVHGNLRALEDLLGKVLVELSRDDVLVFLGDYIDRGPDSRGCLERIVRLREEADFQVVALQGNHEYWMLRSFRDHTCHYWFLALDSFKTLASYSIEVARELRSEAERAGPALIAGETSLPYEIFFDSLPPAHLQFLQNLVLYHRTRDVASVHGDFPLDRLLLPRNADIFPWEMDGFPDEYKGEDSVVYGHWGASEDKDGWPLPCVKPNRTYGIDTIAKGVLTAMRFPDGKIFQSGRYQSNRVGA